MATKTINQEGITCDATSCDKFFIGEKPKSWKKVAVLDSAEGTIISDACGAKHAKQIAATFVTIS